eukprot:TRINITY_DN4198_c0_g1_i9.p1 TRINITY_DN4198_c0_g1~~TRINITY_DN4198_c0_g1_i9.p1  ORF type:complete len:205 (-),score=28.41 TRINITY_DN4198_c0_g1_i9:25-639(-)
MSTVTMQGLPGGPAENFVKEYLAHLHKLVGNDKLVINTLTELAHVNKAHARTIVHLIERRIKEVEKERHLPHIYLIDSICKNHGEPYIELFERNIIPTFCHIFKYADEKIRASLYKLRSTWSTSNMFERKLTDLDRTINSNLDPAWPIRERQPVYPGSTCPIPSCWGDVGAESAGTITPNPLAHSLALGAVVLPRYTDCCNSYH